MARCCGGSGTCSCRVEAGQGVEVTGVGSALDPFIINALATLDVSDNTTFNLTLSGLGTVDSPWLLSVNYASTAALDDLPDVSDTAPTNGQVLAWNTTTLQWEPTAPTTAASGSVNHGNGLTGDGSIGSPLTPVGNAARYISITASGIGLSDAGLNALVRPFATSTARDSASPALVAGTLTILADDPTALWYYDGTEHLKVTGGMGVDADDEFFSVSGSYAGGPVTTFIRQLATTTDGSGAFVVLSALDLTDYAGVLSVRVTPTGSGTAWSAMLTSGSGVVSGVARRLSDGTVLAGASITGIVEGVLY